MRKKPKILSLHELGLDGDDDDDDFSDDELESCEIEEKKDEVSEEGTSVFCFDDEDLEEEDEEFDASLIECTLEDEQKMFEHNLRHDKKKILWVDDVPENNEYFINIIRENSVEVVLCLDTDSALREFRKSPYSFYLIITDMSRKEKRKDDTEPKQYLEAGIDFIIEARKTTCAIPIFMFSSYCRIKPDLIHRALEAGAKKVCTGEDMQEIIKKHTDKPEKKG